MAQHVAVEPAGEPAVGHDNHDKRVLDLVVRVRASGSESRDAYVAVRNEHLQMASPTAGVLHPLEARRILAAATISMVRVICFVEATELMRRSMS